MTTYPLGRVVQHDPRSRAYPHPEFAYPTIVSKTWTLACPVLNQGNVGSCTGNAAVGAVSGNGVWDAIQAAKLIVPLNEDEALSVYGLAVTFNDPPDTYPPDDVGSSGLAVAKALKQMGLISGYTNCFSFAAVQSALQNGPVITGVPWMDSFDTPLATGECPLPSTATVRGGHEICIYGLDMENQRIWFQNSWGETWGVGGKGFWSFATYQTILANQGDATVFVPLTQPAPTPIPIPTPTPTPDGCLWAAVRPFVLGSASKYSKKDKILASALVVWAKSKSFV